MTKSAELQKMHAPVSSVVDERFAAIGLDQTVGEALEAIRHTELTGQIVYFYVLDSERVLRGVVPTRDLLMAPLEARVRDIMVRRVVAIPDTATILDACDFFVLYKFLAFPVVDRDRRMLGTVNVRFFTEEILGIPEEEGVDDVFEAIGFRVAQVRDAGPLRAFRFRFPWLLATIASGTVCALLVGAFEMTLAQSLVLAFFLTLVLGLGESVSMQSMTVTIQTLRTMRPTFAWYWHALVRELGAALLLGLGCGVLVGLIVWVWRGAPVEGGVIGASITLSLLTACLLGLSVPTLLHRLKLDPKIAAGPVTLALTDICTVLIYFGMAALVLGR